MKTKAHLSFLEQSALREAKKLSRRRIPVGIQEFLALLVQTIEPWKRILCVCIGVGIGATAWWLYHEEMNRWAIGFLVALAIFTLSVGLLGWKRPVEIVLDTTAELVYRRLLDGP